MMKSILLWLGLLPATVLGFASALDAADVTIGAPDSPMLRFALGKLEEALLARGDVLKRTAHRGPDPSALITVTVDPAAPAAIGPDGFLRVRSGKGLRITGGDDRGAMYGVLDVAQRIRMGTPWDERRGSSFAPSSSTCRGRPTGRVRPSSSTRKPARTFSIGRRSWT
jgi:hypothetical protein